MQDKSSGQTTLKGFMFKVTNGVGETAKSFTMEIAESTTNFNNDVSLEKDELNSINKVTSEVFGTLIGAMTTLVTLASADTQARNARYAEEAKVRNENETKRLQNDIDENEKRREHEIRMHELRANSTTKSQIGRASCRERV